MAHIRIPLHAAGRALALAGVLFATSVVHPDILRHDVAETVRTTPAWAAIHLAAFASAALSAFGAIGLVAAHRGSLGARGDAALVLTLVGCAVAAPVMFLEAIALPPIADHAPALLDNPGPMVTTGALALSAPSVLWPAGLGLLGWSAACRGATVGGWWLAASAAGFLVLAGPFVPVLGPLATLAFAGALVWWGRWLVEASMALAAAPD